MIATIYKVHGMADNYIAVVCEENRTIYFADEESFEEPGVLMDNCVDFDDDNLLFYIMDYCDVTDWDAYPLEEWAEENEREADDEAWNDMKWEFVNENGNADVLKTWEDAEVL